MATSEEAKPHPMVKPDIPRVMMGKGEYLTNEERIKKDEEELLALKKEALGITDEESTPKCWGRGNNQGCFNDSQ